MCRSYYGGECIYYGNIAKVDSIISNDSSPYSLEFWDFNANINKMGANGHTFGDELRKYCIEENINITDLHVFHLSDSYTYLSETHRTSSWILNNK